MAAGAWQIHDGWLNSVHKGDVDTDTDVFSIRLYTSLSNINDTSINAAASLTNELPTASGYTSGGLVRAVTVSESLGAVTFDIADAEWTASGGSISARYAGIIDNTVGLVVAHSLLDVAPADVTSSNGKPFTIEIAPTGVYSLIQT